MECLARRFLLKTLSKSCQFTSDSWISRELTIAAEIPISVDHGNVDAVLEKMANVLEAVANHVTSPSKKGSLNLIVASRVVQRHT